jgi:acetyltransferase-like isoleucine patch superfamily enzyme
MSYTDVRYKLRRVGSNVVIGRNVYFRYPELIEIGDNVIIDEFCYFTSAVSLGSFVHIAPHCTSIGGRDAKLTMADFSGLSAGCRIICASDDYFTGLTNPNIPQEFRGPVKTGEVSIGRHAVLGTATVVHPAASIGEGAATGSMTLVTRDLDPWTVYTGIPARERGKRDRDRILELERQFHAHMNNQ